MIAEAQHISQRYDSELKAVQNRVLAMGELIERQIDTALAALVAGDHALAEQVERMDHAAEFATAQNIKDNG